MIRKIAGAAVVVLVAIQFVRPSIPYPPVTAEFSAPTEVRQILKTSCYGCHSNETKLAWFDQAVPGYWLVARDVKEGRRHLNFSEIGQLTAAQQKAALYEAVNQIQSGTMPLAAYTRLHRNAIVTPAQLGVLKAFLNPPLAGAIRSSETDMAADSRQYDQWIHKSNSAKVVAPSPNGIEFPAGYQNWKTISATDRFDNQTLRVILGNDIAIQAIAENRINPWPDGTTFAKIAWAARADGSGAVRAGVFLQVEFMIRDGKKFAATKGWGWARWRGTDLTPYGSDAGFVNECIGCHTPVRDSDYVFTMPIRGQR